MEYILDEFHRRIERPVLPRLEAVHNALLERLGLHPGVYGLVVVAQVGEDLGKLNLEPSPVVGDVCGALDATVVQDV